MVKGVCNRRLADLIATYQIPVPFSFINFRDVVLQFAQRVPNITLGKLEVNVVEGTCFTCRKPCHIAKDCLQQQKPPTCCRCNAVGHVATKCRVRDVYCQICKNKHHVTDVCYTKQAPRTTAVTAGSAPRIHATQETDNQADRVSSRSEELRVVS